MKKVLKLIFISVLLFISFIIISMTSISTKYVERSLISFDVNNASNPQMKKIIRKLDNLYAVYLLKISDDQKSRLGLNSDWFLEAAEDFEMIVSLPSGLSDIPLNWTKIGKISTGKPEVFISDNGKNQKVKPKGFNHFK